MISYIQGKIYNKSEQSITILTNSGVGYEINVSPAFYLDLNLENELGLYTYLAVRENAMDLYGFRSLDEKDLFQKFLSVSGVGPKSALHLISLGTVLEISSAIARGDVEYLTKVSGVGKRTAERIVVELQSKLEGQGAGNGERIDGALAEVVDGLVAMGYSKQEARDTVKSLDANNKTSEQLLREALKTKT